MTIKEAIDRVDDACRGNQYTTEEKVRWLSELDMEIYRDDLLTHEGGWVSTVPFEGYNKATDMDTQLLVTAPDDVIYPHYLEAQICYRNHEYTAYDNAMAMFNVEILDYRKAFNRSHLPLSNGRIRF